MLPPKPSAESAPAAVILAAGASQRFGAHKLSQSMTIAGREKPLVVHTLQQWLEVFANCVLVVRPADQDLTDALTALTSSQLACVHLVAAGQASSGMAFSLQAGIAETAAAPGWLIGLADMPWVPTEILQRLKQAVESGASLVAPFYQGRRGHPVGFARQWYSQLMSLQGDRGARDILQKHADLEQLVCDSPDILRDIDTPADMG